MTHPATLREPQLGKVFGAGTFRFRGGWRVSSVQRFSIGRAPRGCFSLRTIAMCDGRVEGIEEVESSLHANAPRGTDTHPAAQARAMLDAVDLVLAAQHTTCSGPVALRDVTRCLPTWRDAERGDSRDGVLIRRRSEDGAYLNEHLLHVSKAHASKRANNGMLALSAGGQHSAAQLAAEASTQ